MFSLFLQQLSLLGSLFCLMLQLVQWCPDNFDVRAVNISLTKEVATNLDI